MIFGTTALKVRATAFLTAILLAACGGASNQTPDAPSTGAAAPAPAAVEGGDAAEPSGRENLLAESASSASITWVECAAENDTCRFSGTRNVRYGTESRAVVKRFTNGVACTNANFGDPAYGEGKNCWYDLQLDGPPPTTSDAPGTTTSGSTVTSWTHCAAEWQTCRFTGTRQVRYGTAASNFIKTFTGGVVCSNANFGDPAFGIGKNCWYGTATNSGGTTPTPSPAPAPSADAGGWTRCASEWQTCNFSGTRQVRYGTASQYVTKTFSNGVNCTNAVFGDPVPGVGKTCWYGDVTSGAAPSSTPSTPAPSAPAPTAPAPSTPVPTAPAPAASPTPALGGVASPTAIKGKTASGPIVASSGQVIENLHISNPNGRCITVPAGVSNVVIRNNEIGPCGADGSGVDTDGVRIFDGATNVTIQRNVIHDVSSAVTAYRARHPIVMDRNFIYNVRGPFYRGQMIQMEEVSGGTSGSKITCNVADGQYGSIWRPEDVINLYASPGLDGGTHRTEVAYNRIRGTSTISQNGSGVMTGDGSGGGNVWVHHNTIVNVVNAGIGIAGGTNITLESNRVYMTGPKSALGMYVRNYSGNACSGHKVLNNRVYTLDNMYQNGAPMNFEDSGACGAVTQSGNTWGDGSLSAAIFDEVPGQCQ